MPILYEYIVHYYPNDLINVNNIYIYNDLSDYYITKFDSPNIIHCINYTTNHQYLFSQMSYNHLISMQIDFNSFINCWTHLKEEKDVIYELINGWI